MEGPGKSNIELQLSPEQMEAIMAKVQDVNVKGTAYTSVMGAAHVPPIEALPSILKDGLLGLPDVHNIRKTIGDVRKIMWYDSLKNKKMKGAVHFQILGRTIDHFSYFPEPIKSIKDTASKGYIGNGEDSIVLIFDISSFLENPAASGVEYSIKTGRSYNQRTHTFSAHDTGPKTEDGITMADQEYGFIASSRVAPRFFRGVLCSVSLKPPFKRDESGRIKYFDTDIEKVKAQAEKIKRIMLDVDKTKPELLLPIYDIDGNLLWPKQMTYEEVKKFVAERDSEKTS